MSVGVEIEKLVCGTIAVAAKRDSHDISRTTMLADLAIDSLSLTTLIALLEATFGLALTADDKMAIYDADDIDAILKVACAAVH